MICYIGILICWAHSYIEFAYGNFQKFRNLLVACIVMIFVIIGCFVLECITENTPVMNFLFLFCYFFACVGILFPTVIKSNKLIKLSSQLDSNNLPPVEAKEIQQQYNDILSYISKFNKILFVLLGISFFWIILVIFISFTGYKKVQ